MKGKDERMQTKRPNINKDTITSVHQSSQLCRVEIRTFECKTKSKLLPTENICLLTRSDQGDREKANQADKGNTRLIKAIKTTLCTCILLNIEM